MHTIKLRGKAPSKYFKKEKKILQRWWSLARLKRVCAWFFYFLLWPHILIWNRRKAVSAFSIRQFPLIFNSNPETSKKQKYREQTFARVINTYLYLKSFNLFNYQKHSSIGLLKRECSKKMQQFYRRIPIPDCDFNKVALPCKATLLKSHFNMGVPL